MAQSMDAAPGKPQVKNADLNCITLEWDPPRSKAEYIMCYEVSYKQINTSSWETCITDNFEPKIDFLDLDDNATYVARVCAAFGVTTGPFSQESDPFSKKNPFMSHTNEYSNMPLTSPPPASPHESLPSSHTHQELDNPPYNHPTLVSMPYNPAYIAFPEEMGGHMTSTPSNNTESSGHNVVKMHDKTSPFYRPQNIQANQELNHPLYNESTPVSMPYNSEAYIAFPEEMGGQKTCAPSKNRESSGKDVVKMQPDKTSPFYRPQNVQASPASTLKQLSTKPVNVEGKCVSPSEVKIKWKFNAENCRYCEIEYKKNGKGGWQHEVTKEPTTSHKMEIDHDAMTYSIRVRSVMENGLGPYSDTLEVQVKEEKRQDVVAPVPPRPQDRITSNRKADENLSHKLAEKPGRPQIKDCDITYDSVELTWKEPRQCSNITHYEILFKTQKETKWVNENTDDADTSYTVYGLTSGMKYEFQTRAVFNFDRSGPKSEISRQVTTLGAVVEVEETVEVEPQKPNQPQQPESKSVTGDSITIQWSGDDSEEIDFYEVQYRIEDEDEDDWKVTKTKSAQSQHTVEGLYPGREYTFRVRGVNDQGKGKHSFESLPIKTKTTAARLVKKQSKKITYEQPAQYLIKMKITSNDKSKKIQHMRFGSPPQIHQPEKTIMVVGATGSGKSTLINGILNYLLDVKWEDNFRFVIIDSSTEKPGASQAHSQTQYITCYKIHPVDGSKLTYTLNIVDTPGFGDTSGIARDKELVEQIRTLFGTPGKLSLQSIDAVCFVAPAGQARLTPTQRYIFESVLSMFGNDIGDNIVALLTFADGSEPPVLVALREANVPFSESFNFNNCALFESNVKAESRPANKSFSKMFWDMGNKSFQLFFDELGQMPSKSLTLSALVLEERKHLEAKVEGLQKSITDGLSKAETLRQEQTTLEQHDVDIAANKDFKYEVEEVTQVKVDLDPGQYVTNCLTCNSTCHFTCTIASDQEKYNCDAMSPTMAKHNRTCTVCPGKCIWNLHHNNPYRFELKKETKTKTYEECKDKLEKSTGKREDQLIVVDEIKKEINSLQGNIANAISDITTALRRLNDIALKPNPLTNLDYIDLLLSTEAQEAKEGYRGRIVALKKVREQAVIVQEAEKPNSTFFTLK